MAERLEILFELRNLQQVLGDINRVAAAVNQVGATAAAGARGRGSIAAEGAMSRVAVAAIAAAGALRTLMDHVQQTAQNIREFGDTRLLSGGTTGQTALARAIAAATGLGDPAGTAAAVRQAIAAGGLARSFASQAGVGTVLPPGFQGVNELKILLQVMEQIRAAGSDLEAQRIADVYGNRDLLRARLLTEQQMQRIRALAEANERAFSPQIEENARNFALRVQEIDSFFRRTANQTFFGTGFLNALFRTAIGPVLSELFFPRGQVQREADALRTNTDALNANTVAIGNLRAVFGGGERARGALPAGFRGELLRKQMESDALKLGAFKL